MPSDNPIPERFRAPIIKVVHDLVVRNFVGLVEDGRASGWTPETLEKAVDLHPDKLAELPENIWDDSYTYAKYFERYRLWDIMVPLWTAKAGRSNLMLQIDISETDHEILLVTREIHVL